MATKRLSKKLAVEAVTLAAVVAATLENSFVYTNEGEHTAWVMEGLAEVNPGMVEEGTGKIATRATQKGIDSLNPAATLQSTETETQASKAVTSESKKMTIEIETGIAIPTVKRGRQGSSYPFADLPVGGSFHIPKTAENQAPEKSIASTVTVQNAKYSVGTGEMEEAEVSVFATDEAGKRIKGEDGKFIKSGTKTVTREKTKQERQFVVRVVGEDDPKGPGARVFRVL